MKIVRFVMSIALVMFMFSQAEAKNYPNNYKAGYNHGCKTAKGNYKKDKQAFRSNSQYRNGWNAGKRKCKKRAGNKAANNRLNSRQIGYNHGCASARGHWRKDAHAFRRFAAYRNGWNAGKKKCKKRAGNIVAKNRLNSRQVGYNHGCASARGKWRKDAHAFKRFAAYRNGWNSGFRKCKNKVAKNRLNSYNAGYNHGCASARGHWRKDANAFKRFAAYRNGWNAGKRACRRTVPNNAMNSYNTGYNHGCVSARGNWRKNTNAYNRFNKYRRGWNAGNRACRRSVINNAMNSYNTGYNHGCRSAEGSWRKNTNAYNRFNKYRRGWNAGNRACRRPLVPVIPAVPLMQEPIIKEVEVVKVVQNQMIEAAKEFTQAKYIKEASDKPIQLQIRINKSNEKYGALEFTVSNEDGSPFVKQDIADAVYLLCLEKTEDGWEVISDLTRSDVPSNEELIEIKRYLPEDFPLDLLPAAWIDFFNVLEKSPAESNATRV